MLRVEIDQMLREGVRRSGWCYVGGHTRVGDRELCLYMFQFANKFGSTVFPTPSSLLEPLYLFTGLWLSHIADCCLWSFTLIYRGLQLIRVCGALV